MSNKGRLLLTYVCIAAATIGFSLNGVFGGLLEFSSGVISWGRGVSASIGLFLFLRVKGEDLLVFHNREDIAKMVLLGLFMSGNWYLFYVAIKASSVAIAVVSLFTYPFITSILEPFFFYEQFRIIDLVGALFVLTGIWLISPGFRLNSSSTWGILWGMLSGLCFSLRNLLSRKLLKGYSSSEMSLYQFMVAGVVFSPFLLFNSTPFTVRNAGILFVFGAVITTLSFVLFTWSLRRITASLASILLSTQPVVTVALNYLIVGEVPTERTILGGAIISVSVILVSVIHYLKSRSVKKTS